MMLFSLKIQKKQKLPTLEEIQKKAEQYVIDCGLINFYSKNDIILVKGRFSHGYEQAIKDLIDPKYKPK